RRHARIPAFRLHDHLRLTGADSRHVPIGTGRNGGSAIGVRHAVATAAPDGGLTSTALSTHTDSATSQPCTCTGGEARVAPSRRRELVEVVDPDRALEI